MVLFVRALSDELAFGFADFPVFLKHARLFLDTGHLYLSDISFQNYHPGALVYKYPPFFAALLLPIAASGIGGTALTVQWLLQIFLYLGALGLGIAIFAPAGAALFLPLALTLGLNFQPYFETLHGLQLETPLLLLLSLCLLLLRRGEDAAAGMLLGICAMLKVYPVFLLTFFILKKRWTVVWACLGTSAALLLGTVAVIGVRENSLYFLKILPFLLRNDLPVVSPENLSIARYATELLGMSPLAAKWAGTALFLALSGLTAAAILRGNPGGKDSWREAWEFLAFLSLIPLGLTNSWANYQLLLLLPILALLARCLSAEPSPTGLSAAVLAGCFLLMFSENTPDIRGYYPVPRPLHEFLIDMKILSNLLIWGGIVSVLRSVPKNRAESEGRE